MEINWKSGLHRLWRSWGFSVVAALFVATSFKSAIADWNDIPSGSMKPSLLIGDRIFVNKLAYDLKVPYTTWHLATWAHPERGDIVVFYSPKDGTRLVKRVVGLPGDTIAMDKNHLIINGLRVNYAPLKGKAKGDDSSRLFPHAILFSEDLPGRQHPVMWMPQRPSLHSFGALTVPEGKYFMLGDNRDNSADSRYFGYVDRRLVVGQATRVALSRKGTILHPRWNRFFRELK